MSENRPIRVLMLCSGLDHAKRGFESFARECIAVLGDEPAVDIELLKASGPPGERERAVPAITRESPLLRALGRASRREPFRFEQAAFALSALPFIARRRPDVVYFSEWHTGLVLGLLGRAMPPMVLCNGTMAIEHFGHLTRVQELTPAAMRVVLERGGDPARHVLLPLGFAIPERYEPPGAEERDALRARLGLPAGRPVLTCSAALNRGHKRLDYLIEEVARLPEPRPFVLLIGEPDADTPAVRALAADRLGPEGHSIRTVPQHEVGLLLRASDAFVLPSLGEGLPRALIEALAEGLPCLVHDYEVTRFALGEHGRYADFSRPGALAGLLAGLQAEPLGAAASERHDSAYARFSWDRLRPRYVELLRGAAA
jgi:1,2-diacylglycerol 3-alpha-glucosyltransferase